MLQVNETLQSCFMAVFPTSSPNSALTSAGPAIEETMRQAFALMLLSSIILTRSSNVVYWNNQANGKKHLVWTSPGSGQEHVFFYGNYFPESILIRPKLHKETQSGASIQELELMPHTACRRLVLPPTMQQKNGICEPIRGAMVPPDLMESTMMEAIDAFRTTHFRAPALMPQQNEEGVIELRKVEKDQAHEFMRKWMGSDIIITNFGGQIPSEKYRITRTLRTPKVAPLEQWMKIMIFAQCHRGKSPVPPQRDIFQQWLSDTVDAMQKLKGEHFRRIMNLLWERIPESPFKISQWSLIHNLFSESASSPRNSAFITSIGSYTKDALDLLTDLVFDLWACAMQQLVFDLALTVNNRIHQTQYACHQVDCDIDTMFKTYRRQIQCRIHDKQSMLNDLSTASQQLKDWMKSNSSLTEVNAFIRTYRNAAFLMNTGEVMVVIRFVAKWLGTPQRRRALILMAEGEREPPKFVLQLVREMADSKCVKTIGF